MSSLRQVADKVSGLSNDLGAEVDKINRLITKFSSIEPINPVVFNLAILLLSCMIGHLFGFYLKKNFINRTVKFIASGMLFVGATFAASPDIIDISTSFGLLAIVLLSTIFISNFFTNKTSSYE